MTSRVALYARYSTDMQRDASIKDQLRVCRAFAANHSWLIIDSYTQIAPLKEDELTALLASQPNAEPSLHPNLAVIYRERIAALHEALEDPRAKDEAFTVVRTLIEEVRLIPEAGQLRVEIRGALAGILALATNAKTHLRRGADGSVSVLVEQIKLVAGVGFEPTTFRL